jgi:hypothetical protein
VTVGLDCEFTVDTRFELGSSSSSLLMVRSITVLCGRLLAERIVPEAIDCSREETGGVRIIEELIAGCNRGGSGISLISTMSSSLSSSLVSLP